jgi:hypothetical protein
MDPQTIAGEAVFLALLWGTVFVGCFWQVRKEK